jgi:signal transduction histidine kinase/AmiR/NasT family two-component response regulator
MFSNTKSLVGEAAELVSLLERRLNAERAERRRLQKQLDALDLQALDGGADSRALSERLERLIEQRTKALSLARDEAVAASHSKSSFLANMSHEIRTPLTSIIGFAELLQDPKVAKTEKVHAARTIVRNGRHLLEVINDILDMSKIESNRLTLECIDIGLPKLLSDIEALASSRAQEKGLLFTIEHHLPLPPVLRSDPVRLKQILLNFCSNAIKFSKEGEVRLEVRFDPAAKTLCFEVKDGGIGMSPHEVSRLFKPFVQADVSTTRKFGGTGLGLYISKQLADMLGGTIHVTSEPGRGSCFSVTVPVGVETRPLEMLTGSRDFDDFQRPAFQITAIEVPDLSGRVLVAEDGLDNQRLIGSLLRQAGLEFDMVDNGSLAVERALAHDYAVVLMDIQMPVMDGVSATRALRNSSYRGPIIALTANVMQEDALLYRECGCTDVLGKPIDRERFYEVLRMYTTAATGMEGTGEADDYAGELAELTAEFTRGLPATLALIEASARMSDLKALKSLLHTLKGTAGSYGFDDLTEIAAQTEACLGTARPEELVAACQRLSASFATRNQP